MLGQHSTRESETWQRDGNEWALERFADGLERPTRFPNGFFDKGKSGFHKKNVTAG
jgi:hypothetical protein